MFLKLKLLFSKKLQFLFVYINCTKGLHHCIPHMHILYIDETDPLHCCLSISPPCHFKSFQWVALLLPWYTDTMYFSLIPTIICFSCLLSPSRQLLDYSHLCVCVCVYVYTDSAYERKHFKADYHANLKANMIWKSDLTPCCSLQAIYLIFPSCFNSYK
jgi:hypothetical protein